jgi:hypothetical protein
MVVMIIITTGHECIWGTLWGDGLSRKGRGGIED